MEINPAIKLSFNQQLRKIRYIFGIVRKGLLLKYISCYKQSTKDRNISSSDFSVYLAVAAIVKNEVPYIAEWIEYHLIVGVQKFFIYDNESTDNLYEYLKPYINNGIVEYIFFPGKRQQVAVYNDALNRYKYSCYWLSFIDIDEYLTLVSGETLPEFLRDFEDVPGIEINQVLYGSGGNKIKTEGLVIERFKDHSYYDYYANKGVKSIINPRKIFYMQCAHTAKYFLGEYSVNSDKIKNIMPYSERSALHDKIRRNHYACKSYEEFISRIDLGRATSPGKLSIDEFKNRDRNEIKNDPIMDKYIQKVKNNLDFRFNKKSNYG
ncbi:MAG: glycosyltransferase family 92 protein [Treponema sp.]|nr:glycosyltransferase family 92 protein [Treponema sp.]